MFSYKLDGRYRKVEQEVTIFQACFKVGLDLPRFCYHERLSIAGNCRMCLVEVVKSPKPVASCAMPIVNGMEVYSNTSGVKKIREGVMELLLANHPLDCPICDQGGECDLQDQAMVFGTDRGRFYERKRAVSDKNCGPFVKTVMTRCIHCTRCVRFLKEVSGEGFFGSLGRGSDMEIGPYIDTAISSEMSGNIIDLCPVGALTSKPYAFMGRPWELKSNESIDVFDGIGSNLRIDCRGEDIMRVLPVINEELNEEWLSDKARFSYDGLRKQRILYPMVKRSGRFVRVSWSAVLSYISVIFSANSKEIDGVISSNLDGESLLAFKDFFTRFGTPNLYSQDNLGVIGGNRMNLLKNLEFSSENNKELIGVKKQYYLVGICPSIDAPNLNLKIKREVYNGLAEVFYIGVNVEDAELHYYDYPVYYLGNGTSVLKEVLDGNSDIAPFEAADICKKVIIGDNLLVRDDADIWVSNLNKLNSLFNDVEVVVYNSKPNSRLTQSLLLGVDSNSMSNRLGKRVVKRGKYVNPNGFNKIAYCVGTDDLELVSSEEDVLVIYQGSHGDPLARVADIILPGATFAEKEGSYVNYKEKVQYSQFIFYPPEEARNDWRVFKVLGEYLYKRNKVEYENLEEVRGKLIEEVPYYYMGREEGKKVEINKEKRKGVNSSFVSLIDNYYMTNNISRASQNMANASLNLINNYTNYYY